MFVELPRRKIARLVRFWEAAGKPGKGGFIES